ncbi:MAG: dTDP-4-dehydrorhamnose 3,5-epimerase [Bdellovibrio sp.]
MSFIKTPIKDLIVFEPKIFADSRGFFFESFNRKTFEDAGIDGNFIQDNQSFSRYGTVRGLHFQKGQAAQAKLVRVLQGSVLDVAVDLRPNSPTFGQHYSVELSEENHKQLYIPRGFAHGFVTLSETACFFYKCDNFYSPKDEGGICYNDPILKIDWRISTDNICLSDKDRKLETFEEFKRTL